MSIKLQDIIYSIKISEKEKNLEWVIWNLQQFIFVFQVIELNNTVLIGV